MQDHALVIIVLLLFLTVVMVSVSRRISIPPIINYILVGFIVGPFGFGLVQNENTIHKIAEFGIVFLLFSIGLEFSLSQMMAMRKLVFGLGTLQVTATGFLAYLVSSQLFGLQFNESIVVASAVALSSTAIVIKQLTEQSEIQTRHGRSAVGILIFQDIMAIPLLILIPALGMASSPETLAGDLATSFYKGAIVVAVMLLVGRYLLRPIFKEVASAKSQEVFTLTVLTVVLSAAAFTEEMGISMTLGAFMAGMMLGETEYRHQIEADIRPFQDILLGLFFITVGMLISLDTLSSNLATILIITLLLISLKALLIYGAMRLFQKNPGVSFRTALSLAQVGEFGLVLITLAIGYNLLTQEHGQILLTSGVISMVIAPFLVKYNGALAKKYFSESYGNNLSDLVINIEEETKYITDHVLLLGFGRAGQTTAKFLKESNVAFVALDMDIQRVQEAHQSGEPVYFGDSANQNILHAAHIDKAKVAIITFNDYHAALKTLKSIKAMQPNLPVLVRTRDDSHLETLLAAGATEVVPDAFEASIMLASHLLLMIGHPPHKVIKQTRSARNNRYAIMNGLYAGETDEPAAQLSLKDLISSVLIEESAYQMGRCIDDIPFNTLNVTVKAVIRDGVRGDFPDRCTPIRLNDTLVLQGAPEDLAKAINWINSGHE